MTIISAIFFLCLGLLIGYQLPVLLNWWRDYRYRKTFKFSVLRPTHHARRTPTADSDEAAR